MVHYTYVLRCDDESLYTGYTNNVSRRVEEHNSGDGAKYTSGRTPVRVVYVQMHTSKSCAMSEEYSFKQLSKQEKESKVGDRNKIYVDFCTECYDVV